MMLIENTNHALQTLRRVGRVTGSGGANCHAGPAFPAFRGLLLALLVAASGWRIGEVGRDGDDPGQQVDAVRPADSGGGKEGRGKPGKGGAGGGADAGTDAGTDSGGPQGGNDGDGLVRGPQPTVQSASKAGPYTVRSYTSGFRDGPQFADATIWYPGNAEAPFAIAAVVPGWVSTQADIATWGPFLASHGIVNITIGTNSPATDLPEHRRDALLDALASLELENTRMAGPLFGKLELDRQAVLGWSMGGGGALLAANENPSLKAAVSMCGWGAFDLSDQDVPSLMFAASLDVLAGGMSQPFYESIPRRTPKLLYEVEPCRPLGRQQSEQPERSDRSVWAFMAEGLPRRRRALSDLPLEDALERLGLQGESAPVARLAGRPGPSALSAVC